MKKRKIIIVFLVIAVSVLFVSSQIREPVAKKIVPDKKDLIINTPKDPEYGIIVIKDMNGNEYDRYQGRIRVTKEKNLYIVEIYSEEKKNEAAETSD